MKVISVILLVLVLGLVGCMPGDPLPEDLYTKNVYPGTNTTYDIGSEEYQYADGYFTTLHAANIVSDGDIVADSLTVFGDVTAVGDIVGNSLTAGLEGYSVDFVQDYISGIILNDTFSMTFGFEPSKIVVSYSARCHHDTTFEGAHTTGHSLVTITGIDTMTISTNYVAIRDYNGAINTSMLHDINHVLMAIGGYDGIDHAKCWGTGTSWTTATHTLLVTFDTVEHCRDAWNFFEIMATAYR